MHNSTKTLLILNVNNCGKIMGHEHYILCLLIKQISHIKCYPDASVCYL